jgi:HAD superfamily hydrolase (TIGR01484 family)
MTWTKSIIQKKVIIFDLDGTLTKSKASLDKKMASLIFELLKRKSVAVASGGAFQQFKTQFLTKLPRDTNFGNLFLFPTSSASGYYYDKNSKRFYKAYDNLLTKRDAKTIIRAFETVFKEIGYVQPTKTFGPVLENRGSQVTFSALGQSAPLRLKKKWDPKQRKRQGIRQVLDKYLPDFEISIGGTTSIDVTRKGVNKTLCVKMLKEHLRINETQMLYVGDALFRGGNDYIMKRTNITCLPVSGPEETKSLISRIIERDSSSKASDISDGSVAEL